MSEPRFISQHLHRLFSDHDCVVIPGLGGFVCNQRPARYDEDRQELTPPSRDILFNERLIHNDGVLAHVLASTGSLSYAQALAEIEREADWMRAALRAGDPVTLAHVGRLFRSSPTDPVAFLASPTLEQLLQSYGLQRIPLRSLASLKEPVEAQATAPRPAQVVPLDPTARRAAHPMWRKIAAALAIPVIAGSAYLGIQQDASLLHAFPWVRSAGHEAAASAFLPRFAEEGVHVPDAVETLDVNHLENLLGSVTDAAMIRYDFVADEVRADGTRIRLKAEEGQEKLEHPSAPVPAPVANEQYWLVAGAFRVPKNAVDYAAEAKASGWNAAVRSGEGELNMVILGAFADVDAARQEMAQIRAAGEFQVWLKKL